MSYLDVGYGTFLTDQSNLDFNAGQLDPLASETFLQNIPGSKMSGLIQSQDGRVKIDLDNNTIIISDGIAERVRLGKQDDGSYGLVVKDSDQNALIQITGNTNVIKSADNTLEINFDTTQFLVRDAAGLIRVLLGKDVGGF